MSRRFAGTCEWIADVELGGLVDWVTSIDLADWHQQSPIDNQLRPAMMTDLNWHGFGSQTDPIVAKLAEQFAWDRTRQRMLSVVMPRHDIQPHVDEQGHEWLCRVHVPLTTNSASQFIVGGIAHAMHVGGAYRVNTLSTHAVVNNGSTPRIHFMFDVTQ